MDNSAAPYLNALVSDSATALFTQFYALTVPSQPNYLTRFSGSDQGVTTSDIPKNLPFNSLNLPLTSFTSIYELLPTVSFVISNQVNDMHDGIDPERIYKADAWLKDNLDVYVQWAQSHNSLVVITFDENQVRKGGLFNRIISFSQDGNEGGSQESKHICTAFVGEMVKPGSYDQKTDHYNVLRTVE